MKNRLFILLLIFILPINYCFGAVDFDGVNDFVGSTALDLGNSSITISFWVNLDSNSETGCFINIGDPGNNGNGWGIGVGATTFSDSGNNLIMVYNWVRWIDTNDNIGTGWHHIVMTLDASGYPESFIDSVSNYDDSTGAPNDPIARYDIGGYPYATFADCWITEVAIWSTVLSQAEINQLYTSKIKGLPLQIQPSNLELYLPLDDYSAGTDFATVSDASKYDHSADGNCVLYYDMDTDEDPIQDQTTNNNDGSLKAANEPDYTSSGKFGGAYSFDGSDDYVDIGTNCGLDNIDDAMMCWVNLDSTSEKGLFMEYGDDTDGVGLGVGTNDADTAGNDLIGLCDFIEWDDTNTAIGTGWHHVAVVLADAEDLFYYIDGVFVYYENNNPNTPADAGALGANKAAGGRNVDAILDEVAYYTTEVIPAKIAEIAGKYVAYDYSGNAKHGYYSAGTAIGEEVLSYPPSPITQ